MPNYYEEAFYESQKKQCVDVEGTREWPCPVCKLGHNGCHAEGSPTCSCGCRCNVINGQLLDELMNFNLCR